MNAPHTKATARIDELLRRSSLRVEQQRIHVAELADHQALHAVGVLTDMLASIDRLTKYRAKVASSRMRSPGEQWQCATTK
jgi:hypothetical protein